MVPVALASVTAACARRFLIGVGPLFQAPAHDAVFATKTLLGCLVMGTSDLTKDLRARHTHDRLPVITSLSFMGCDSGSPAETDDSTPNRRGHRGRPITRQVAA